jgi:hypothetical protein
MFQRNITLPFTGLKGDQARSRRATRALLSDCFCLDLFFGPEDGGDIFLRNFYWPCRTIRRNIPEDRTLHRYEVYFQIHFPED